MKQSPHSSQRAFTAQLGMYKKLIDADIAVYAKKMREETAVTYGQYSSEAVEAYLAILERGGKRIRGALAMVAYEMCGGTNTAMITEVARAIEMVHAYALIIDDINDRSLTRRGGPAAHAILTQWYDQQKLGSDAEHFAESIAMNAALIGNHEAQVILANLQGVDDPCKLKAIGAFNQSLVVTIHGQVNDNFHEVVKEVSEAEVDKVLEWKTAYYTFLNPLHIGMILAGADSKSLEAITPYALHAGRAFQITDDILGTFGSQQESGKSPMDDLREGKRTLLTTYALTHAQSANKQFLLKMLGNAKLTEAEFTRCKTILMETGALKHAQTESQKHIEQAIASLHKINKHWSTEGSQFLEGLALYLQQRQS